VIALLKGNVVHREPNRAILDVQGVGYELFAPNRTIETWSASREPVIAHVSTQVREDAITLYGFGTATEREGFQVLMSVSGIGPKLALACLDAYSLDQLSRAVDGDDHATLSRIPGVGKKTAQRLALELKGKLPASFSPRPDAPAAAAAPAEDTLALALQRLGYGRAEIDRARAALVRDGIPDTAPVSDRLRAALKALYGGDR
jgi:Holliday junction DNA helicase RuvA